MENLKKRDLEVLGALVVMEKLVREYPEITAKAAVVKAAAAGAEEKRPRLRRINPRTGGPYVRSPQARRNMSEAQRRLHAAKKK